MNNKGFMMAEVVVVSSIILVALTIFYVNYNKLISLYNDRLNYYDPTTLYKLADYRNRNYSSLDLDKNEIVSERSDGRQYNTYLTLYSKIDELKGLSSVNKTFKEYIGYLSGKLLIDDNYLLIMENCKTDDTDCKYAYLEVLVRE